MEGWLDPELMGGVRKWKANEERGGVRKGRGDWQLT